MHVIWVFGKPTCCDERPNGFINRFTATITNIVELARLFNSWYATRNRWCEFKLMLINKIWWCNHSYNSSKIIIYWCTKRNTNVPRSTSKDTKYSLEYVILYMFKMWDNWLNIWEGPQQNNNGYIRDIKCI